MKLVRSVLTRASLLGVASGAVLIAATAHAQSDSGQTDAQVGQIVVTAEKRETLLEKTPATITAVTASQIQAEDIKTVEQLQYSVPSLIYGTQTGYTFLAIRGIGADSTDLGGESAVATYQDGVYTGSLITQDVPQFDLARIEILEGPQGTLYGRNTTGGVINYITKDPSFDPQENLELTAGSYGRAELDGGVTGPIVADKIAFRASIQLANDDGYRENINLGQRVDSQRQWGGRGELLFKPTSNFHFTVRGDYLNENSSNPYEFLSGQDIVNISPLDLLISPALPLGVFSEPASYFTAHPGLLSPADTARLNGGSIAQFEGLSSQPGVPPPNPNTSTDVSNAISPSYHVIATGGSVTADWDLGAADLKSITAYRYSMMNAVVDSGGIGTPEVLFSPLYQTTKQFTQELDASGSAFDKKIEWVAGAFYMNADSEFAAQLFLPAYSDYLTAFTSLSAAGGGNEFSLSQPIQSHLFQIPNILATPVIKGPNIGGRGTLEPNNINTIPSTAFLGWLGLQNSQSVAGFGQVTFNITDKLHLIAGVRYTYDEKSVDRTYHSNLLTYFGATGGLCQEQKNADSWSAPTGTLGLNYDLSDHSMAYVTYSRGYNAGGFSGNDCAGPFNPEYVDSYETGIKAVLAHGQFLINADAYYFNYSDIQVTTFVQDATIRTNAGAAEAEGVELQYKAQPDALPGVSLDGSASFEHSAYTRGNPFSKSGLYYDPSGLYQLNIVGNELMRAPEFAFSTGWQYATKAGDGTITLRGEAAWTDKFYNDIFDGKAPYQSDVTQPAYWLVNARLLWTRDDRKIQVQLFGENLTDSLYANNRISFNAPPYTLGVSGQFAAPRTFGVRLILRN